MMKFTLSWLNEHLKLNNTVTQIAEKLTNLGLEVESVDSLNGNFQNFFICKILKSYKHPNADRLKVCEISYREKTYKVVCGATENIFTIFLGIAEHDIHFQIFELIATPFESILIVFVHPYKKNFTK